MLFRQAFEKTGDSVPFRQLRQTHRQNMPETKVFLRQNRPSIEKRQFPDWVSPVKSGAYACLTWRGRVVEAKSSLWT